MGVVSFSKVNAMAVAICNLDSQHRFLPATIDRSANSPGQIQEAVLVSDSMVVLGDVDNPYHYRNLQPSGDLDHGDSVPGGVMRPCTVLIKVGATDSVYVGGIRGRWTWDQIERWRENYHNLYGPYAHNATGSPLGGKFVFKGNKIGFTGSKARIVRAPEFVIDRTTPACQADEIYTMLVLSGAIWLLYQEGMVSDKLFTEHKAVWEPGLKALQARAIQLLGNTEE